MQNRRQRLIDELSKRILVLDGGLGTMVQGYNLCESDYRGEEFKDWSIELKGCNDLLVLTREDVLSRIHDAYLLAGADIITTDSFNANAVSLADYALEEYAYRINLKAAMLARSVADDHTSRNPHKPRFVAGSVGPTNRTASMSADVLDPSARAVTFAQLYDAYTTQIEGLVDGGVDLILIETIFDTLNAKAAIKALIDYNARTGKNVPSVISATVTDASGRTLSGQTIEAFYASIAHCKPLAVGLNCGYGAEKMKPYIARLANVARCAISCHPNAGLPNGFGGYDETPTMMAETIEGYLKDGLINIIGGCCGTTPAHIGAIASVVSSYSPRKVVEIPLVTTLSGLEPLRIVPENNFINIGERSNVAGSAKFAKMIRDGRYSDALIVAREQVEAGAQIIDVCMDDGLIDGPKAMRTFLNLIASEPEISRVPIMIDSSSWDVLKEGLECVQGKCVVNSISLKEGEQLFVERALQIRSYGAAVVVMLFDEQGQADTFDRKIEVAQRAYDLLVANGFPAEDIIFDPNVLSVATGIEAHNSYGIDFIRACRWIKDNLPYAKLSGGISNLSFSFRGNNPVREAMHSAFLFHAVEAGLDMGIVNPAMLQVYSDIEPELLTLVEDVVLNRNEQATDALTEYAAKLKASEVQNGESKSDTTPEWRTIPLEDRLTYAIIHGDSQYIAADTQEIYDNGMEPLKIIEGPLMRGMNSVGEMFGAGKMFLPQVVKSARVMKLAVEVLTPYISGKESDEKENSSRVLLATVKGDVHDIGKNIVSVVLSCNGYEVEDLGVMVDTETIVERAADPSVAYVALSGLITPSLAEMAHVIEEMTKRNILKPVFVGGATTSALHTAVKLAPLHKDLVIHTRDASDIVRVMNELTADRNTFAYKLKKSQEELKEVFESRAAVREYLSLDEARKRAVKIDSSNIVTPQRLGRLVFCDYSLRELVPYIDWSFFFSAWELKGRYPEILEDEHKGEQARKLLDDANKMLDKIIEENLIHADGVVGIYAANADGDDIVIYKDDNRQEEMARLAQLRNQSAEGDSNPCLADYLADRTSTVGDYLTLFSVSAGRGVKELVEKYRSEGDDYNAFMVKLLADRLAEAFAQAVHHLVRVSLFGFEKADQLSHKDMLSGDYRGIRVAIGYPSAPDHSLKREILDVLGASLTAGISMTENFMTTPEETVTGMIFNAPEATLFSVDQISTDQFDDYCTRRDIDKEMIKKLIWKHISK